MRFKRSNSNKLDNDKGRNLAGFLLQQEEADKRPVGKGCSISETVLFRVFLNESDLTKGLRSSSPGLSLSTWCVEAESHALIVNYLVVKLGARYCLTRAERMAGE